ncbi:hypothetical protein J4476_03860 [Candidatus Woesearchaeota archaeon]|nr:hypothetical protein [Candidatus Woesearchaeota archaeon]HIH26343.1 hypothetical protein [Nanoarchaeota archaeon]
MNTKILKLIQISLIIFGIFLLIQILRKIFGGSWSTEDIVVALLLFNTSIIFTSTIILVQLRSDQRYLRKDVEILIKDLKKLGNDFKTLNK